MRKISWKLRLVSASLLWDIGHCSKLPLSNFPVKKNEIWKKNLNFHKKLTANDIDLKLWPVVNHSTYICLTSQKLGQWRHDVIVTSFPVFYPIFSIPFRFFSIISWSHDAQGLIFGIGIAICPKKVPWKFQGVSLIRTWDIHFRFRWPIFKFFTFSIAFVTETVTL